MKTLTDSMIINGFTTSSPILRLILIFLGIMFLFLVIKEFIKFKIAKTTNTKKSVIIGILIVLLLLGIPGFKLLLEYNAINYSVENNSWYVEKDTVEKTRTSTTRKHRRISYHVYLSKYGKVSVDRNTYYALSNGDSVYVVIVKGKFGGTYATNQIYPTDEYIYEK